MLLGDLAALGPGGRAFAGGVKGGLGAAALVLPSLVLGAVFSQALRRLRERGGETKRGPSGNAFLFPEDA